MRLEAVTDLLTRKSAPRRQGTEDAASTLSPSASQRCVARERERRAAALRLTDSTLAGLIPPDGILSFSEPATLRTITENKKASSFDSLDKALVVFRHPANGTTRKRDMYRRVDLIFARWPSFGAAVLGWSGSTQFERDLRKHAEKLYVRRLSPGIDPATASPVYACS